MKCSMCSGTGSIESQTVTPWGCTACGGTDVLLATGREEKLRLLCGEILATLRANLLAGRLTTENDDIFEAKLNEWNERMIL